MQRLVFIDSEVTGISVNEGHRIVELCCVELLDCTITGTRHWYFNPNYEISPNIEKIIGITNKQVANSPCFCSKSVEILDFFSDSPLVSHNIPFEVQFLNMEFELCSLPKIHNSTIDMLSIARSKFSGRPVGVEALRRLFRPDEETNDGESYSFFTALFLANIYQELLEVGWKY